MRQSHWVVVRQGQMVEEQVESAHSQQSSSPLGHSHWLF